MNTVYIDWSMRNGVTGVFNDEAVVKKWPEGTTSLLDALDTPHRIVAESTIHSYLPEEREAFLDRCVTEGHEVLFTPARETGRWNREHARDKDDLTDPFTIRDIALSAAHLRKPHQVTQERIDRRVAANLEIRLLRVSKKKNAFGKEIAKVLVPYRDLSDIDKLALGNGKRYSWVLLAALGIAAKHASGRKQFEQLCGLYAHGYPSQLRADIYHWQWSGGSTRARLNGVRKKDGFGLRKRDDLTLSQFRRSIRSVYAQLHTANLVNYA